MLSQLSNVHLGALISSGGGVGAFLAMGIMFKKEGGGVLHFNGSDSTVNSPQAKIATNLKKVEKSLMYLI
jgi:hypothetical protein